MTHSIQTLPVLIMNPYNRCNCRCVMCDIWKRDTAQEISWELFERQLPEMERLGVRWVVFSGGEPLMHSGLFRFCSELRKRNIRVTLLSSGLLLERYAPEIVNHVDDVIVSLDGPPETHNRIRHVANAFELLARGVSRISSLDPGYRIAARCTVQRLNCGQLVETTDVARNLGLHSISFLAADVHSAAFNRQTPLPGESLTNGIALTSAQLPLLDLQIETLATRGECGKFVLESAVKLRAIARHFRSSLGMLEPVAPVCNAPWTSAVIESDGSVRPCFFHPAVGSLRDGTPLGDVLNGPELMAFRTGLSVPDNPVCQRCVCSLNWKPQS